MKYLLLMTSYQGVEFVPKSGFGVVAESYAAYENHDPLYALIVDAEDDDQAHKIYWAWVESTTGYGDYPQQLIGLYQIGDGSRPLTTKEEVAAWIRRRDEKDREQRAKNIKSAADQERLLLVELMKKYPDVVNKP